MFSHCEIFGQNLICLFTKEKLIGLHEEQFDYIQQTLLMYNGKQFQVPGFIDMVTPSASGMMDVRPLFDYNACIQLKLFKSTSVNPKIRLPHTIFVQMIVTL